MNSITVAVPDSVDCRAPIRAAEQGTSISSLVSQYLQSLSTREIDVAELEAAQKRVQRTIKRFSASDRFGREAVHGRR